MLKLNAFLKEQNIWFSLKRNKVESFDFLNESINLQIIGDLNVRT